MKRKMYRVLAGLMGLRLVLTLFGGSVAPAAQAQEGSPDPIPGAPGVFTERVCAGMDALIFQTPEESGAGVTVSSRDDWNCMENATMLIIGPWGTSPANAHSACRAEGRQEVDDMNTRVGWGNGSAWVLNEGNVALDHPMVTRCETVNSLDDLGLNPHQSYVVPGDLPWTITRATELRELAGLSNQEYWNQHWTEALSVNILYPTWWEWFLEAIANW